MTKQQQTSEANLAMIEKILELPCFRLHPLFPIVSLLEINFGCGVKAHADMLFQAKFPCRYAIESYRQMRDMAVKTMDRTIEHLEALERGESPEPFAVVSMVEVPSPNSEGH